MNTLIQDGCSWLSERKLLIVEAISLLPVVVLIGLGVYDFLYSASDDIRPSSSNNMIVVTIFIFGPLAGGVPIFVTSISTTLRYMCNNFTINKWVVVLIVIYIGGVVITILIHYLIGINTLWGGRIFIASLLVSNLSVAVLSIHIVNRLVTTGR